MDIGLRDVRSAAADRDQGTFALRLGISLAPTVLALLLWGAAPAAAEEQQPGASAVEAPEYGQGVRLAWKRQIISTSEAGARGIDTAYGVATDGEGNVVVAGLTDTGGGGPGEEGPVWAWLRKYTAAGKRLWERQIDTPQSDSARGVAVDRGGNIVVTGNSSHGCCFDAYLAKYSQDGQLRWKREVVSPAGLDLVSWGVGVDAKANVFITGSTNGTLSGSNHGGYDAWIAKYSEGGQQLWVRQFGTVDDDLARGVAVDSEGNAFIVGYTTEPPVGDFKRSWIAKYSRGGRLIWKRPFGARASGSRAEGIAADGSGNVIVTGLNNVSRVQLAKYDTTGNIVWNLETPYTGISDEVAANAKGDVLVSGTAYVNSDKADVGVAKYDSDGHLVWSRLIASDTDNYSGAAALDGRGNAVVAGWDAIPGDAWVAKFHEE